MSHGHRAALWALILFAALGVALQVHVWCFKVEGGFDAVAAGFLVWSVCPYALALAIGRRWRAPQTAWLGAALALGFDLVIYREVFIAPSSSTAAIALIFSPAIGLVLVALGTAIGYGAWRLRRGSERAGTP